jgi:hypothetical protein
VKCSVDIQDGVWIGVGFAPGIEESCTRSCILHNFSNLVSVLIVYSPLEVTSNTLSENSAKLLLLKATRGGP